MITVLIVIFFIALLTMLIAWAITILMRINSGYWKKKALIISAIISACAIVIDVAILTTALLI
jgi:hypothetical protein